MPSPFPNPIEAAQLVRQGRGAELRTEQSDPYDLKKKELFAIEAHLSELVVADFDESRRAASPTGLLRTHNGITAVVSSMESGSISLSDVLSSAGRSGGDTLTHFDVTNRQVLERPENAENVRRAAQLIDEMPEREFVGRRYVHNHRPHDADDIDNMTAYEQRDGRWVETDASFVYRNLRLGIRLQTGSFNWDTLDMIQQAVLAVDPGITDDEMIEIARRSGALVMQPAAMGAMQLRMFFAALSVPPEQEGLALVTQMTGGRPHPGNYVYEPKARRVRYRKFPREFEVLSPIEQDDGSDKRVRQTVGSFVGDDRKMPSAEGCPFRIPVEEGGPSPLRSKFQDAVTDLTPVWRDAFPHVRVKGRDELAEIHGDRDLYFLDMEGVSGIHVVVREARTGVTTLDPDDVSTLDALEFSRDKRVLRVRMKDGHALDPSCPHHLILRMSKTNNVRLIGNEEVSTRVWFLEASVPDGGRLDFEADSARVITSDTARVDAVTHGRTDVEVRTTPAGREIRRERPVVALRTDARREDVRVSGASSGRVSVQPITGSPARSRSSWRDHAVPLPHADTQAQRQKWLQRLDVPDSGHVGRQMYWFHNPGVYADERARYSAARAAGRPRRVRRAEVPRVSREATQRVSPVPGDNGGRRAEGPDRVVAHVSARRAGERRVEPRRVEPVERAPRAAPQPGPADRPTRNLDRS